LPYRERKEERDTFNSDAIDEDVGYWHLADIDADDEHVCFWG